MTSIQTRVTLKNQVEAKMNAVTFLFKDADKSDANKMRFNDLMFNQFQLGSTPDTKFEAAYTKWLAEASAFETDLQEQKPHDQVK